MHIRLSYGGLECPRRDLDPHAPSGAPAPQAGVSTRFHHPDEPRRSFAAGKARGDFLMATDTRRVGRGVRSGWLLRRTAGTQTAGALDMLSLCLPESPLQVPVLRPPRYERGAPPLS